METEKTKISRVFAFETREHLRFRIIALAIIIAISLFGGFLAVTSLFSEGTSLSEVFSSIRPDLSLLTPSTLFYSGAISGLFFFPVPLEATFYLGVTNGSPVIASILAVIGGFILGNIVSYLIGWKLSRAVSHLVSAKKMYALRRKVNTYGSWAVLVVNMIPAPSPLLTFSLGIAKYNIARLFFFLILGNIIKFSVLGLIVTFGSF